MINNQVNSNVDPGEADNDIRNRQRQFYQFVEELRRLNPEGYIDSLDPVIKKHYQINVANKQGMGPGYYKDPNNHLIQHLYPDQTNSPVNNDPRYSDPRIDPRSHLYGDPNIPCTANFDVFNSRNNSNLNFGGNMNFGNQNNNSLGLGFSPQEDMYHQQQMQHMNIQEKQNYLANLRYQIQQNARNEITDPRVLLQQELERQRQENTYHQQQIQNMNPYDRQGYINQVQAQRNQRIGQMVANMLPNIREWFLNSLNAATNPGYNPNNGYNQNQGYFPNQGYNPNVNTGYNPNQNYNPNMGYMANNSSLSSYANPMLHNATISSGYGNPNINSNYNSILNSSTKYDDPTPNHDQFMNNQNQNPSQAFSGLSQGNYNTERPTWNPEGGTYANIYGTKKPQPKQSNPNVSQNRTTQTDPRYNVQRNKPVMSNGRDAIEPIVQSMFNDIEEEGPYHSFNADDGVDDHEDYGGRSFISMEDREKDRDLYAYFGDDDVSISEAMDMSAYPDPVWDGQTKINHEPEPSKPNLNFSMGNAPTRSQQEAVARAKLDEISNKKTKEYYFKLCARLLEKRSHAINNPPASSDVINTPMSEVEDADTIYAEESQVVSSLGEAVLANKTAKFSTLGDNYMKGIYGAPYKLVQEKVCNHSMKDMVENFIISAKDYQEFCTNLAGYFPAMLEVVKTKADKEDKGKLLMEAYESYTYMVEVDKHMCHLLNKFLKETLDVDLIMESISGDGIHMLRELQKRYGQRLFDVFHNQANMVLKSVQASYKEEEQKEVSEYMESDSNFKVEECKYIIRRSYILNMPIDEGKLTFIDNNTIIREDSKDDINLIFMELKKAGIRANKQLGSFGVFDMYVLTLTGDLYNATFNAAQRHYKLTKVTNY